MQGHIKTYYRFQDLISSDSISIAADFDFVWQLAHRNLKPVDITESRLLLHDGVLPLFQLTNLWIFKKMVCLEDTTPFMQGHKTYYTQTRVIVDEIRHYYPELSVLRFRVFVRDLDVWQQCGEKLHIIHTDLSESQHEYTQTRVIVDEIRHYYPELSVSVPRPNFIRFHLDCSRFRFCLATCSSKSQTRRHHWVQIVASWWGFTTFPTHEPVDFQENGLSWRYNTIYAMI